MNMYEDLMSDHCIEGGKLIAYILDADSLGVKDFLEFEEFEFKKDIEFADKSSITVYRQPNADTDDYVICKSNGTTIFTGIFKEYSSQSKSNEYKLKLLQKEKLFDRFIFTTNEEIISSTGIEDFIAATIESNWISSGDSMLDKTYMSVEALTHTKVYAKVSSIVSLTDGCFNLKTFLGNALEKYGIKIEFQITSQTLNISVFKDEGGTIKVNTKDSDISEFSETYSVDALTKLSVLWNQTSGNDVIATTNYEYYLLADRTITTNVDDEERAKGSAKSMIIEAETEEEMYQSVQDEFSSNSYSHKISFDLYMKSQLYDYSDFYLGRSITINTKNGLRTTIVTEISVSDKSGFASITLGKLKVTLIDKIRSTV